MSNIIWPSRFGGAVGKSFLFNGTSAYMEMLSPPVTDAPCTFAAWFKTDTVDVANAVCAIGGSTSRLSIEDNNTVGDTMGASAVNTTGTGRTSSSPATYSPGTWYHLAGVFASTTSRTCYQDGVAGTANTTSQAASSVTKLTIGTRYSSGSRGAFMHGRIAHVAIWNVALSGADIASLAAHALPSSVQSGNLVFYADLQNGLAVDSISSTSLTVVNATSSTDGPF